MYNISDKVTLITGGTRGIGFAIAHQILEAGGKVVLNGRSLTDEAKDLQSRYGEQRVAIELGDVSKPSVAQGLVDNVASRFGGVDILIHSAGGPVPGSITELDESAWMDAFAVHVHPVFHLFRAAFPHLKVNRGAVLLISSVAGLRGCPNTVAYQTVKGALIPLARAMAFDNAAHGIRVNVVAPGIIRTRFHEAMTEQAKEHNIANRIPLRREGSIDDVAEAAMVMLQNEFITGEVLTVDGGMSMRVTA